MINIFYTCSHQLGKEKVFDVEAKLNKTKKLKNKMKKKVNYTCEVITCSFRPPHVKKKCPKTF